MPSRSPALMHATNESATRPASDAGTRSFTGSPPSLWSPQPERSQRRAVAGRPSQAPDDQAGSASALGDAAEPSSGRLGAGHGSVSSNVVPSPSPGLVAVTVPPWRSTMLRQM